MTGLKLPPVYQLGYVVGDIDKACEFYQSTYGVGPFQVIDDPDRHNQSQEFSAKIALLGGHDAPRAFLRLGLEQDLQ